MGKFFTRTVIAPAVMVGLIWAGKGLEPEQSAQDSVSAPVSDFVPVKVIDVADAEQTVSNDLWSGMGQDASNCWEHEKDQWGRTATTAFVKDVGGMAAYEVSADKAFYDAADGKVWVLAWCE